MMLYVTLKDTLSEHVLLVDVHEDTWQVTCVYCWFCKVVKELVPRLISRVLQ